MLFQREITHGFKNEFIHAKENRWISRSRNFQEVDSRKIVFDSLAIFAPYFNVLFQREMKYEFSFLETNDDLEVTCLIADIDGGRKGEKRRKNNIQKEREREMY